MEPEHRIERVLSIFHSFAEEEQATRQYWWAKPPLERLAHVEELRRLNYGYSPSATGLQRVLEIAVRA